jgi:biotin carboxyl carrier protein
MKMQNEIKTPKTGKVEKMFVAEGQAVNAGETLAIVS